MFFARVWAFWRKSLISTSSLDPLFPFSMIEGTTSCMQRSKKLRASFNLTNKSHLCDCGVYSPEWHSAQGKSCNDTHHKCKVKTRNQEEYTRPWIGDCLHAVGKDVIFCAAFENPVDSQAVKKVNIFFHEENNAADFPWKYLQKVYIIELVKVQPPASK